MNKGLAFTAAVMAAECAFAANSRFQPPSDGPTLQLQVAPGIAVRGYSQAGRFLCDDNARCQFDQYSGSRVEMEASGSTAGRYHWVGCSSTPAPNRCDVVIGAENVLVSVR